MFGRDNYLIVVSCETASAVDWCVRDIQWLRVDLTVDRKIELKTKRTRVNVAWRQRNFVRIATRPRIVVVVGKNISRVS